MSLEDLQNVIAEELYGMTKEEAINAGICIQCKKPPTFYSDAGRREYQISGLCEPCFDEITKEPEDVEKQVPMHDEFCAIFEGQECNCPSAALGVSEPEEEAE